MNDFRIYIKVAICMVFCIDLVVTSSQPQCLYLQVTVLWVDMRKGFISHLTTSAVSAEPVRKRRLLSTIFDNARLLLVLVISTQLSSPSCSAQFLLLPWFWYNMVRERTAFTTGCYTCSNELCDIRATTPTNT